MKESEFQKLVLSWLKKKGYKCWKNYLGPLFIQGGKYAKNPNKGQPDIYGILKSKPGMLFAIELKSAKGKLSDEQKTEMRELEQAGCLIIAVRDMEHFIEDMEKFDYAN